MAYTTINNGKIYFNTKLYTGNGGTNAITGVGFQPDWLWIKSRGSSSNHNLFDSVRGTDRLIFSNLANAEVDGGTILSSFNTDGFTLGVGDDSNKNSDTFASWNWLGAGTAPSKTYTVKVVSDSGNKYRFDDFGTSAVTLEISEGGTYTFDQADSSNSGHPIRFSTTSDGSHGGGSEYTTGVTTNGTPGSAGAYTRITVAASAPTLYYYCTAHSGMGGQANTPTTNSFSNFSGSIQSNISPNTTAGFSIVSYSGSASNVTVGHGLGVVPKMIIFKNRTSSSSWTVYHNSLGASNRLVLNNSNAQESTNQFSFGTSPTSSVFALGGGYGDVCTSGATYVAYCFSEVKGYSKFGSYTGNGNADGPFVYTGFKPAFVMIKDTTSSGLVWNIRDNKRDTFNPNDTVLYANSSEVENEHGDNDVDWLSNGFKMLSTNGHTNASGDNYIYMAFAENPFTSSTGTPVTAR